MIIMNMPSIGLYQSRYKSRPKLRNRNFIAFILAFLASFCILFHLISFNNYGLKSLAACLDNGGGGGGESSRLAERRSEDKGDNNQGANHDQLEVNQGSETGYIFNENTYGYRHSMDDNGNESLNTDYNEDKNEINGYYKKDELSSPGEIEDILVDHHQNIPPVNVHFSRTRRQLPSCIIIGVRKGGTRALLEFLNLHPSIQKVSDEVHFFNDNVKYGYGLDWYRKQMPYSFPGQVTIEKTPAYFITDLVPHRIHAMNSSIKLILIVRDPVTRLISDYAQLAENKAKRDRIVASFEKMVIQSNGMVNIAYKPVRTSLYSIYYSKWLQLFPGSQLHVVDGDRLVYDPFPEVQKVETFLGLEHKIGRDHFIYNVTKGFYCVRINGTLEKCLNESKGRPHPSVNPKVIQILRHFYRPYNYQFYKMTGKNFKWPEV